MAVIKDNYLFPIYCDNAIPVDGEKNFHATGADIADTVYAADLFVKKTGDSMSGDLIMEDPSLTVYTNRVSTHSHSALNLSVDDDPFILLYAGDTLIPDSIIGYKPLYIDTIRGRSFEYVSLSDNRIVDLKDPEDDQDAVTKKYVDDAVNILQNEVIELEEELEAIAPSLARGTYFYEKAVVLPTEDPAIAHFYLIDDQNQVTDQYEEAAKVVIHNTNRENFTLTWAEVKVGQLIQIYDKPDEGVLLGEITSIDKNSYVDAVAFDIENLGASGSPGDNPDTQGYYISRLNIFDAPLGGDASMFVLKTGDKMIGPGPLEFLTSDDSNRYIAPTAESYIKFENTRNNGGKSVINLYNTGTNSILMTDGYFMSKYSFYSNGGYYYGTNNYSAVSPRVFLGSSQGELKWNSNTSGTDTRIMWNNTEIKHKLNNETLFYQNYSNSGGYKNILYHKTYISYNPNCRLYAYKAPNNSNDHHGDPGQVLASNGNNGPAYWGDATGSNYVKTNDTGWAGNLTITKSGGNYYITGG